MYKRREKVGYFLLGFIILVIVGLSLFQTPETTEEWIDMLFFLFLAVFVLIIIIISRSQYNKVKDFQIPNSEQQLLNLNHVVIKMDVALIPRRLLFENDGKFIGVVKPMGISWWMYPFLILDSSFILFLPLTYGFITHDGKTQFTFQKKGWFKQVKLTIFDQENREIGTYIQEELKASLHIKGKLLNEKEEEILSIKASGIYGDFRWDDEVGNQWAYFYNGKFPHEYTNIFRDTHNDIIELSDKLSKQDKIRLLAVIGYVFMERVKP